MAFNSVFSWIMKKRLHQIDFFKNHPLDVQAVVFDHLLSAGKETSFGRCHKLESVTTYSDFQKSVPLQDYDSLKPWIEKLMEGNQLLLWPDETNWFAKSSGTTGDRSKYIPVTKESLYECHYKGGKDLLALYYSNFPNRKLYNGKHLIVGGSAQVLPLQSNGYTGDLSAIIVKNLPWWAERRRTPSREIALMSDWEPKIQRMAESTIKDDVYIIAGVPSWTLVLANRVLELTGAKHLREVWPNLELFLHGGVSFEPYREAFRKLIPFDDMHYVETYNASEGFFGIQDNPEITDMLLMLDYGIFYEFIPMDEFDGLNSKKVIDISQVKAGVNYALVISTSGGLWRYIVGDTVQFSSTLPFRFRITGRTKSFINVFGEEVIVDNTDRAVAAACAHTDAQIRDYTVCPVFMQGKEKGAHEWVVEFITPPSNDGEFMQCLDQTLRALNSDYDAKRTNNMALDFPTLNILGEGGFDRWLKSSGKLGGQHKVPRLSNNRDIVEQLLQKA